MNKFTCPMHPEMQKDKLGKWPKCGMPLVPKNKAQQNGAGLGALL